ncbi:MAG: iron uptake porin [Hydrococcus sp. Prado102]|nr:iron uptake porin [Hydrococcus sp. Prado102]
MSKLILKAGIPAVLGFSLLITNNAIAAPTDEIKKTSQQTENSPTEIFDFSQNDPMGQVTNVNELRDVAPTEWAYEALRSLVERYGCIVGYSDRTYKGNRALTRWEFAAGLNACINTMERLIGENVAVLKEDIDTLKRLSQEFEAELATLGGRVDNLEGRVSFLEDHQFSTTTKLSGEVIFGVAGATNNGGTDNQIVFQNRVRLYLETSFTGEDVLTTGLAAGNSPPFALPTNPGANPDVRSSEGTLTFQNYSDNDVILDFLSYYFPVSDWANFFVTATYGANTDYLPTTGNEPINDGSSGGSGALSLFGSHNAIYLIGGGTGAGFNFKFGDIAQLSGSYLATFADAPNPSEGAGFFNGSYAALGQVTLTPTKDLTFALTYINNYNTPGTPIFNFGYATFGDDIPGLVGTSFANFPGGTDAGVQTNSFGVQASYRINPKFIISAWGGYTIADVRNTNFNEGEIWNYALTLAFPDLLKEGSLGGVVVGVEPYLGNPSELGFINASNNIPLHLEAFYRYPLNDNISITPGIIYLSAPDQQNDEDAFIGVLRTTFTF